jgi:hypothetical protein
MLLSQSGQLGRVVFLGVRTSTRGEGGGWKYGYVIGQVFLPTSTPSFHRYNSFLLTLQSHVGFLA